MTETSKDAAPVHTVPPLAQRVKGVLLDPVTTFRELDPSWGLMGPWLAIMVAGLLYAVVSIAQVDATRIGNQRSAYAETLVSSQQKRMSAGEEKAVDPGKGYAFLHRLELLGAPTVTSILRIVLTGLVLFGAAATLGGKKDLLRAIVVSAHAKLVALVSYAALFIGTIMGNSEPRTSLYNAADDVANPVAAAVLGFVDPIAIWGSVLLGIGLVVSLGLTRKKAVLVVGSLHVASWLLALAGAAASAAGRK